MRLRNPQRKRFTRKMHSMRLRETHNVKGLQEDYHCTQKVHKQIALDAIPSTINPSGHPSPHHHPPIHPFIPPSNHHRTHTHITNILTTVFSRPRPRNKHQYADSHMLVSSSPNRSRRGSVLIQFPAYESLSLYIFCFFCFCDVFIITSGNAR